MHLFLTIIVILTSLGYLGVIMEGPQSHQTFTIPVMAMLCYGIIEFIRDCKDASDENDSLYQDSWRNSYYQDEVWYNSRSARRYRKDTITTTTYRPLERERTVTERTIQTYPSRKEVASKIAELEKNPFWRAKRWLYSIFGNDITAKLYEPTVTVEKVPVAKQTILSYLDEKEKSEYNCVVKNVGRSFEIAMQDETKCETTKEDKNNE